jgi:enoyl-CoA hydratase/carnithine racemase
MEFEQIKYEIEDRIATITLNQPDKLNAISGIMINDMIKAFDMADADDDVRVVIMTGAGRGFCAGADLSSGGWAAPEALAELKEKHQDGGGLVSLRIFNMIKPIIAAINGPAVGMGLTMTLPMDIRLASETAKMGMVFTRRGIIPDGCATWFLTRIVGVSQAMEWIMTGKVFPAKKALEAGLVSQLVPPEKLLPTARKIAAEIADNTSAISVALSRQMLYRMLGADHPMEANKIESRYLPFMFRSPDCQEGVNSFLEKRPPKFKMKPSKDLPDSYPWWDEPTFD